MESLGSEMESLGSEMTILGRILNKHGPQIAIRIHLIEKCCPKPLP